jgi:hypothetical protein
MVIVLVVWPDDFAVQSGEAGDNTASLGRCCWSWCEAVDGDGVGDPGGGGLGVLSGFESVVGSAALAGRASTGPGTDR